MNVMEYLFKVPTSVPEGRILVHNNVYPVCRRSGVRGSRYWLDDPDPNRYEACNCTWAQELGTHYRVQARILAQYRQPAALHT
jgi:hypothetical protein